MKEPFVIISVLNWVRFSDTLECLHHLRALQYSNFHIIVVDNGSGNDSAEEIHRNFPDTEVIALKSNHGFAAGHKVAADIAMRRNADLLWLLNPDVRIMADSLNKLVEAFHRHGEAVYGSITLKSENPNIIDFGGGDEMTDDTVFTHFTYNNFENCVLQECRHKLTERRVQSVEGCSMMIPVEVIRKQGFMDTRFFLYGEETDYCLRLWKKGVASIIVPSSVVVHRGAASFEENDQRSVVEQYYRTRNWRLLARKYFGMTRKKMLYERGGWQAFLKFYTRWMFSGKTFRNKYRMMFFENLAVVHAILGIKGKKVKPEKYTRK